MARIGWGACGVCGNPEASITKNASETISVRCHRCEYSGFAKAGTKAARAILAQMTPDQDAPAADPVPAAPAPKAKAAPAPVLKSPVSVFSLGDL